jgi:hypothetical protein
VLDAKSSENKKQKQQKQQKQQQKGGEEKSRKLHITALTSFGSCEGKLSLGE